MWQRRKKSEVAERGIRATAFSAACPSSSLRWPPPQRLEHGLTPSPPNPHKSLNDLLLGEEETAGIPAGWGLTDCKAQPPPLWRWESKAAKGFVKDCGVYRF